MERLRNPSADGTAMITPNPAAVATARWIGRLYSAIIGTPNVPPPIPISAEKNPSAAASEALKMPLCLG